MLSVTHMMAAEAHDSPDCIWLKHTSGSMSCVTLESNPQIEFSGDQVIVGSRSFLLDDIVSYRFGSVDESSVDAIKGENNLVLFMENVIEVYGNGIPADVKLYNSQGVGLPLNISAKEGGKLSIDISSLYADVYILTIGDESFKFVKR